MAEKERGHTISARHGNKGEVKTTKGGKFKGSIRGKTSRIQHKESVFCKEGENRHDRARRVRERRGKAELGR